MKRWGWHLVLALAVLGQQGAVLAAEAGSTPAGSKQPTALIDRASERTTFEQEAGKPFAVEQIRALDYNDFVVARYRAVVRLTVGPQVYSGSVMVVWNPAGESGMKQVSLDTPVTLTNAQGHLDKDQFYNLMSLSTDMVTGTPGASGLTITETGVLDADDDNRQIWYVNYDNGKSAFIIAEPDGQGWKATGIGGVVTPLLKSVANLTAASGI